MSSPDFDQLAGAAFLPDGSTGKIEDLDRLWLATLRLPAWLFPLSSKHSDLQPAFFSWPAGQPDAKTWAYAFTDSAKLEGFARSEKMIPEGEQVLFLSMTPRQAMEWIGRVSASSEVAGILFNQGPTGWYCPTPRFSPIMTHLFDKGGLLPGEVL